MATLGTGVALVLVLATPAVGSLRLGVSPMKVPLTLDRGEERTVAIRVYNNGDNAVRVTTGIGDWIGTGDGGIQLLPAGSHPRGAAGWISVDLSEFTVPAHGTQMVRMTVKMPGEAEGSYWTMVFFEGQSEQARSPLGVRTRVRMATTVYLTARGTEVRDDTLTDMQVVSGPEEGQVLLSASLANRGNVHYYPKGWFQVMNPEGGVVFEQEIPFRVSLPGTEIRYALPWTPGYGGEFTLVVTIDTGQETLLQGIKRFDTRDLGPGPAVSEPARISRGG
jgi:hypothetical protein